MIRLYHNPRCSKSREALSLLENAGAEVEVIDYLKTPPGVDELTRLLQLLELEPRQLMRRKEEEYSALDLDDITLTPEQLIRALADNPRLLERPIAVAGEHAVIGRPPERVLALLES